MNDTYYTVQGAQENNIMSNLNTTYNQNGIEAEKYIEETTSSAYQAYQDNGAEAARLYD
jgi:hypothetical protein